MWSRVQYRFTLQGHTTCEDSMTEHFLLTMQIPIVVMHTCAHPL
jgi:hypothetical protein